MCWLSLGIGLVLSFAHAAEEAEKKLQGPWTATKAERNGKAADDVVGNRLSFSGNRFQIESRTASSFMREPSDWIQAKSRPRLTLSIGKGS
jgi:uncharacterized protein (TIGR03067 family)